ncbi:OmpP1/FadL family transporter [Sulfurirhabdus autotrophica]|uniref:Long-chain fatty acid transport protein n=1 Tax=Sulfurirhabdus autotrophica TaxID=1706046 RepID=A0A4R3XUJ5_9PROT|nr:outer membrane protein transport protein [Sulfurirhabdus autotrophica]TCV82557.1 long-chain fatty acid transport protein [Sulfurirhabdus autotrophica]
MKLKKLIGIMAIAGLAVPGIASATNGYFSHGYGIKAKGMGGVGIALPQDALAAATNPAGMAMVGDRVDFGVDYFSPKRTATFGAGLPVAAGNYESGSTSFFVPEFGYNKMISSDMSVGVSVFGNGGMNTDYNTGLLSQGGAVSKTNSNLEQLFIAPTWAMKINPNHAIGVSLNLAYSTFKAEGLEGFGIPNHGKDTSTGYGLKLGWTGKIASNVTMGATYQSKTKMKDFYKYSDLFAGRGSFDIPETYGIGIAFDVNPQTVIAADVVQINYGGIRALANVQTNTCALGSDCGSGFGWKDTTVYKLGVSHALSKDLTLRAGYNYAKAPFDGTQTYFNILAPATVEQHLTLGATWTLANKAELSVSYMHAFNKEIKSTTATPVNLKMSQDALGIAYGWKM